MIYIAPNLKENQDALGIGARRQDRQTDSSGFLNDV